MRNSNDAKMWCVTASWLVVVHVNRRKEKEKEGEENGVRFLGATNKAGPWKSQKARAT